MNHVGGRRNMAALGLAGVAAAWAFTGCGSTKSATTPTTPTPAVTTAPATTAPTTTSVPATTAPTTAMATTTTTVAPTTASSSTVAPTTTSLTVPPTTAAPAPSDPQPSADGAATALIHAWANNDQADALTVATPAAVSALFAVAYPPGAAIDRGCSDPTFLPVVCSWGPPGGGDSNDALFELTVAQAGANWYVSSVDVET